MPRKEEYWKRKLRRRAAFKDLLKDFVPSGCDVSFNGLSMKRPPLPTEAERAARVAIYLKRSEDPKRRASLFDPPLMASEVG